MQMLVTGGAGFIGTHHALELARRHRVDARAARIFGRGARQESHLQAGIGHAAFQQLESALQSSSVAEDDD